MYRILSMSLDAAISGVILIPLFCVLNHFFWHNRRRTVFLWIFAIYLSAMFAVVGLPDIRYIRFCPHFNFRPFAYMFSDFTNSALNVLLFVPLGMFLPLLWRYFSSAWRTVLFGFCVSVLIETLQIFTLRATDVNDLITNTFGTLLGWLLGEALLRLFPQIHPSEKTVEVYSINILTFGSMFLVHPFVADWIWMYV